MRVVHFMSVWKISRLIALVSLATSTSAFGSLGAHYLGFDHDQREFRMYLDGGEFLGRNGSFQSIRVTVHQIRKGQPMRALKGCVYHFDDTNRHRDRIECTESTSGPLRGVEYARDLKQRDEEAEAEDIEPMVCVRRCGRLVPQRLSLEEAEQDNH